ncbi:hypothetical protein TWF788_009738 [Orbilia oligospora]|uniref:Uncharacterized protein n=1 Tax=Orbilia oligospora TaxID=2813651 RepID=A0A7C8U5J6_ORBOL|nr:hypothetical protein TWF788_009738 [Orbilia oligospora]
MSALLFPSSVGPGGGYGGGGDDPDRRGGHGRGGHGTDDNYEPRGAEGESDGSSHEGEEEESREELKTPKGSGKKKEKKKAEYNSAKRKKHYRDNNVTAQRATKVAMIDSLNRFGIPNRMGGAPGTYVLADAERSHFCQSTRPEPEQVNDFEYYWKQNPNSRITQLRHKGISPWHSPNHQTLLIGPPLNIHNKHRGNKLIIKGSMDKDKTNRAKGVGKIHMGKTSIMGNNPPGKIVEGEVDPQMAPTIPNRLSSSY